jgi:trk/ktr system potassium uptake protein
MHVIIVGCGRAGAALAARLDAEGDAVCVVDVDPRARELLAPSFHGSYVRGSGMQRRVLDEAGVGRADALVALTQSDSLNIVLARVARDVYHVPHVVGRLGDVEHSLVAVDLGLDMVTTVRLVTDRIYRSLRHRPLDPAYSFGNGESVLVRAPAPAYLSGRLVREFNVEAEIAVVEITRGGHSIVPGPRTTIVERDLLSFVVATGAMDRLKGFLGGRWD